MDADTRARLISLGIDPDKQEVPSSTAPTLADHLTALAELLKPAVAPEAAPLPEVAAPVTQIEAAPAATPYVQTEASEPTPAQPYRPIEQVYTAPEPVEPYRPDTLEALGQKLAEKAADAEPFADPVVTPAPVAVPDTQPEIGRTPLSVSMAVEPVIQAAPAINYSPSGKYIELRDMGAEDINPLTGAPYGAYVEFSNDPQVVEFKKNGTAMATQVDGNHYVKCAIQPLDYIMANKLGFVEGNIVKYATRWQDKDGVVDLKKARDYLDKLIAYVEAAS